MTDYLIIKMLSTLHRAFSYTPISPLKFESGRVILYTSEISHKKFLLNSIAAIAGDVLILGRLYTKADRDVWTEAT